MDPQPFRLRITVESEHDGVQFANAWEGEALANVIANAVTAELYPAPPLSLRYRIAGRVLRTLAGLDPRQEVVQALAPSAAARTLREIAVLASRGLPVADMLTVLADRLEGGQE